MALYEKSNSELTAALSKLTGYVGGTSIYDDEVPKKTKIRLLNYLIQLWSELDSDSELTQGWIKEWKDEIEKLNK